MGSGIFVTPSVVLQNSGSVGVALLLWIGAGIMALFGGLCYSELAGLVPASGGEYAYNIAASRSLGRYWDLVPFLYAWGYTFAVGPASSAIQGQIMASYALSIPYADCDPPRVLHILVTFACIALMTAINSTSVKTSAIIQNALGFIKLAFLISIVGTGVVFAFRGNSLFGSSFFAISGSNPPNVAIAFYAAMYTTNGWQYVSYIAEEITDPARNIPRTVIAGVTTVTTLYVLVNFSYFVVLDEATAESSAAIGVSFASVTWGTSVGWLVPVLVFLCIFGSTLGSALCAGRISLSAARQGHLPAVFSLITVHSSVPLIAVHARGLLAFAYASVGGVDTLIEGSEFIRSVTGLCTVLSLFVLRFSMKDAARPYRVPTVLAVLALFVFLFAVVVPFTQTIGYYQFAAIAVIHFLGVLYYVLFVVYSCQLPGEKVILVNAQKLWTSIFCVDELELILKEKL